MNLLHKKVALWAFLISVILGIILFVLLAFKQRLREAQSRSDAFMALYTPRMYRASTRFTFQLDAEIPPGHWPGIKPGWIIEYRAVSAPTIGGVMYYVSASGEFLHSQPLGWLSSFQKHQSRNSN